MRNVLRWVDAKVFQKQQVYLSAGSYTPTESVYGINTLLTLLLEGAEIYPAKLIWSESLAGLIWPCASGLCFERYMYIYMPTYYIFLDFLIGLNGRHQVKPRLPLPSLVAQNSVFSGLKPHWKRMISSLAVFHNWYTVWYLLYVDSQLPVYLSRCCRQKFLFWNPLHVASLSNRSFNNFHR